MIVECVPNFSEGRDSLVISAISEAVGDLLLDVTADRDHHRCVLTFAGNRKAVADASVAAARVAVNRIDLRHHHGVHPRFGAVDVMPFVPFAGGSLAECADLAREVGMRLWDELRLPVYLYGAAGSKPLEAVRRDAARIGPDIGDGRHATAGACAVGARKILIAWNINLLTSDLNLARSIAATIRESGGGLPAVKALGFPLESRRQVQVSINLVDFEITPLHAVFAAVAEKCHEAGVQIGGSELIGMIPAAALKASARYDLQWLNLRPELVLESVGRYTHQMILRVTAFVFAAFSMMGQTPVELASLRYIETQVGTGAVVAPGKRLTVHYAGYLKDGTKFDSSVDRNEPFHFVQGRKQVIIGWDIGFEGMKVGGKRRLIIPYQLAYGEQGNGPIPAKAELTFDVELLDVADAPVARPSVDLMVPLNELEMRIMAIANAVPEEKYRWRPPSGGASFAEVFARIAELNRAVLAGADQDPAAVKLLEKTNPSQFKTAVVASLSESFAPLKARVESARNGYLSGDAALFEKSTTVRGLFTALDVLLAEQLGRLEAYSNMNGIAFTAIFDLNSSHNQ